MYRGATYLAIGDSITYNIYETTSVNQGETYVGQVTKWIRDNKGPVQTINKGLSGATSGNALSDRAHWSNIRADFVTIMLGTNDAASAYTSTYDTNLTSIILQLRSYNPNVRIVICTPPNTSEATRSPNIAAYRTACANVVAATNTAASPVSLCSMENAWNSNQNSTYLNADGVHPKANGHILMGGLLTSVIQSDAWLNELGDVQ